MKISELVPVFVDEMPEIKEQGVIYISEKYGTAIHLCACGCGVEAVSPLSPFWDNEYTLSKNGDKKITLRPSFGNWRGEHPYHAHYYITDNKIDWLDNVNKVRGDSK